MGMVIEIFKGNTGQLVVMMNQHLTQLTQVGPSKWQSESMEIVFHNITILSQDDSDLAIDSQCSDLMTIDSDDEPMVEEDLVSILSMENRMVGQIEVSSMPASMSNSFVYPLSILSMDDRMVGQVEVSSTPASMSNSFEDPVSILSMDDRMVGQVEVSSLPASMSNSFVYPVSILSMDEQMVDQVEVSSTPVSM